MDISTRSHHKLFELFPKTLYFYIDAQLVKYAQDMFSGTDLNYSRE